MYSIKSVFDKTPVQITTAVIAVVNFLIIKDVISMSADAVSALNIALVAVLGLFISRKTVNIAKLEELAE